MSGMKRPPFYKGCLEHHSVGTNSPLDRHLCCFTYIVEPLFMGHVGRPRVSSNIAWKTLIWTKPLTVCRGEGTSTSPSMSKAEGRAYNPRDLHPCAGCAPNVLCYLGHFPALSGPPPMTHGAGISFLTQTFHGYTHTIGFIPFSHFFLTVA